MTFNELSLKLRSCVQTVPNLISVLSDAFSDMNAGSGYTEDVLYANEGTTAPESITLAHGMSDYDQIIIFGHRSQYPTFFSSVTYAVSCIASNMNIGIYDDAMYAWYTVTSDTVLTKNGTLNIVVDKVIGIKY